MINDATIEQFLDAMASKSATPGGGSAAAILGAMGAALVSMVCNLTIGKKNYEDVSDDMTAVLAEAERLRVQLQDFVRADVDAFDRVMAAYGLPKDTDSEKQARSASIQDALRAATQAPLDCARVSADVIRLCRPVAEKGNKNVISDAGVAVMAAYAALRSAALNVHVNTGAIRDEAFVTRALQSLDTITAGMEAESEAIYQIVRERL